MILNLNEKFGIIITLDEDNNSCPICGCTELGIISTFNKLVPLTIYTTRVEDYFNIKLKKRIELKGETCCCPCCKSILLLSMGLGESVCTRLYFNGTYEKAKLINNNILTKAIETLNSYYNELKG